MVNLAVGFNEYRGRPFSTPSLQNVYCQVAALRAEQTSGKSLLELETVRRAMFN